MARPKQFVRNLPSRTGKPGGVQKAKAPGARGKRPALDERARRRKQAGADADARAALHRQTPALGLAGDGRAPGKAPVGATVSPFERILLVGEGDFSFAASLVDHHGCADVLATAFDSEAAVREKYPTAEAALAALAEAEQPVHFNVDATKLGQHKAIRNHGPYDRIYFNFPHVGGKTKDTARQVRFNQELLLEFFKSARPLLKTGRSELTDDSDALPGSIFLTIFDQPPYTTEWGVKRLAFSAGLVTARSEQFEFGCFPGYSHVRTLGQLKSRAGAGKGAEATEEEEPEEEEDGDDEGDDDQSTPLDKAGTGPGWRGELRKARTYIFQSIPPKKKSGPRRKQKSKQPGSDDSDSDV